MKAQLNDLAANNAVAPEDNPILNGNFAPVDGEQSLDELEVIGTIPAEVSGTLLRNGPNPVNPGPNHHWFSGDAMLHAIKFDQGKALSYRNRWVRTEDLQDKNGLAAAPTIPTELLKQGSGNVNVIHHGGRTLALPEIGLPYEMDLELNTKGQYNYDGAMAGNMTAHPKIDGKTGEMLFFGYDLVAPFLRYHRVDADGALQQSVEIDLPCSVMMHDFAATATRVVFMDLPVILDFDILEQGYNFPFRWDESHQARLGVMDRNASSDTVQWIDIDPCYVFHPLNSYDDGDNIIMDVVRYEKMMSSTADTAYARGSKLVRWTINVAAGTVDSRVICDKNQEFPRVNPLVECHRHRYGYSVETGSKHGFGGLFKHDLDAGSSEYYDVGENCAAGEPIFIPSGEAEDAGYILSVVFDSRSQLSEIHILDAQQFTAKPVAVVKLGARIPFGFHGNFVSA